VGWSEVSPAFSGAPGNSAAEFVLAQQGKSKVNTHSLASAQKNNKNG